MLQFVKGNDAIALLQGSSFIDDWARLWHSSPVRTPYQLPSFVMPWYALYSDEHCPVVLYSYDGDRLTALLTLAQVGNTLTCAGGAQAEYHAWLSESAPSQSLNSILKALDTFIPSHRLTLKYVPAALAPSNAPQATSSRSEWLPLSRPLRELDENSIRASLRKKSNKSKINRLKRLGDIEFSTIDSIAEKIELLTQLTPMYDFRQGAVNGDTPFSSDDRKLPFHEALINQMNEKVHMTAMRINGELVSAHLGIVGDKTVHLAIFCHNPRYAAHSPGKVHLMFLLEHLLDQGFETFDLTPGGDPWKDRFATSADTVYELRHYGSSFHYNRNKFSETCSTAGKRALEVVGVKPDQIRGIVSQLKQGLSGNLPKKILRRMYQKTTLLVYRMDEIPSESIEEKFHKNNLSDLLKFQACEAWLDQRQFLSNAMYRIEHGEVAYTFIKDNQLASYSWLIPAAKHALFSEVQQEMHFPDGSAVLYDAFTHPFSRGNGLQQASFQQRLYDAFNVYGAKQAFVCVTENNAPSKHVIEKYGFKLIGSYTYQRVFYRESKSCYMPTEYISSI